MLARDRGTCWLIALVGGGAFGLGAGMGVRVAVGLAAGLTVGLTAASIQAAWLPFSVARCWLAAAGRLPLRLMPFLADAQRRGVLRQVGGVYQFRHIDLQSRLARQDEPATSADLAPPGPGWHAAGRRSLPWRKPPRPAWSKDGFGYAKGGHARVGHNETCRLTAGIRANPVTADKTRPLPLAQKVRGRVNRSAGGECQVTVAGFEAVTRALKSPAPAVEPPADLGARTLASVQHAILTAGRPGSIQPAVRTAGSGRQPATAANVQQAVHEARDPALTASPAPARMSGWWHWHWNLPVFSLAAALGAAAAAAIVVFAQIGQSAVPVAAGRHVYGENWKLHDVERS